MRLPCHLNLAAETYLIVVTPTDSLVFSGQQVSLTTSGDSLFANGLLIAPNPPTPKLLSEEDYARLNGASPLVADLHARGLSWKQASDSLQAAIAELHAAALQKCDSALASSGDSSAAAQAYLQFIRLSPLVDSSRVHLRLDGEFPRVKVGYRGVPYVISHLLPEARTLNPPLTQADRNCNLVRICLAFASGSQVPAVVLITASGINGLSGDAAQEFLTVGGR